MNLEELEKKVSKNEQKIKDNDKRITKNTGALEILHTINTKSKMFFTMWLLTFIALLCSVGYIIFLLNA